MHFFASANGVIALVLLIKFQVFAKALIKYNKHYFPSPRRLHFRMSVCDARIEQNLASVYAAEILTRKPVLLAQHKNEPA